MVDIEFAKEFDVPMILQLINELADYEKLSKDVVATEELLRKYLFSSKPVAEVLIAKLDEKTVGFALFFINFSTFLSLPGIYLEDLFVKPDFRGQGIGKSLLIELIKIANERGYGRVEWSVLDWNKPAISFYKSLGAQPNDEWTVYRIKQSQFADLIKK